METAPHSVTELRAAYERVLQQKQPSAEQVAWRLSRFDRGMKLIREIERLGKPLHGLRVIDLGAAHGGDCSACVAVGARVTASDFCDYNYSALQRQINAACRNSGRLASVLADVNEKLPFVDDSFDVVLALGIIEHVKDLERFFREIHRILRCDGLAIVDVHVALKSLSADPLYSLPLTAALPMPLRRFVAQRLFRRSYPYPLGPRTFYSSSSVARPARKAGFILEPRKYLDSPVTFLLRRWPAARLWLGLVKRYAFDFLVLRKRNDIG